VNRWSLVPLRAFLGCTFCFAGLQKLANPGFFTAADPASIQSQLSGAVRRSPVHALIAVTRLGRHRVEFADLEELCAGLRPLSPRDRKTPQGNRFRTNNSVYAPGR
jgi:hypothetical protein